MIPRVAPDGFPAAILLAFLGTAGLFYVNIMAAIVTGLSDGLGIAPSQAGLIASMNVYGAAAGAFTAVFLVRRVPWRPVAVAALLILIAIDLASIRLTTVPALVAVRFLHGMTGGLLVGVSYAVFARTASPDRVFGMLLVVQVGLGGFGLWLLPPLVPRFGIGVLFGSLAAFSTVALAMLTLLPAYPPGEGRGPPVHAAAVGRLLARALVGIFMFQAGNMALAAFIIDVGRSAGLSQALIGPTLAISNWLGAAGSFAVALLGARYGRAGPILGAIAITVIATAAFARSDLPPLFIGANIATAILWAFGISYLLGLAAAFDKSGQAAALGGLASKLGLASGPLAAGLLLDHFAYPWLVLASVLLLAASGFAVARPARALDQPSPAPVS